MKYIRGSTATYKHKDGSMECDLVHLAETYCHIGKIPERLGWTKACEIALLSEAFLIIFKRSKKKKVSK